MAPTDPFPQSSSSTGRRDASTNNRSAVGADLSEIVICPRRGWIAINWKEMADFRELLFFLAWRDVKIRYKQTALGVAWAVLQPLTTMIIFSIIFGLYAKIPSQNMPYPVFVFAGLIPWMFFSNGVTAAAQSLVSQQQLLTKIYFPRLFVPTAAVGAFLVDMAVSFGLYALILLFYGIMPGWQIVLLPFLIVATLMATLGFGYTLAALIVLYRDIRYTLPFLMQILMFLSPVIYPATIFGKYRWILALNPMCGIIDGYRSVFLGTQWDPLTMAIGTVVNVGLFVFGLFYFRRVERFFADLA
jgi:lipopolysaccharide transport system permease protein